LNQEVISFTALTRSICSVTEVSAALTKVLLPSPRASDALLLHTLLSTPLPSLKRRGFNTDRILKLKRAERLAEEALASTRAEEGRKMATLEAELRQMFPNASSGEVERALAGHESDHLAHAANALLEAEKTRPPPPVLHQPTAKASTGNTTSVASPAESEQSLATRVPPQAPVSMPKPPKGFFGSIRETIRRPEARSGASSQPTGVAQRPQQAATPTTTPTSQGDIRANVEKIVNASRGSRASSIVSEQKVSSVSEAAEGTLVEHPLESHILCPTDNRTVRRQITALSMAPRRTSSSCLIFRYRARRCNSLPNGACRTPGPSSRHTLARHRALHRSSFSRSAASSSWTRRPL
jgi:hypothetical protein